MDTLLTRDAFRNAVFDRDNHACIFCALPAVDAHHIIERRLWADGGYYLTNGASLCEDHHRSCEQTKISVEEVREACGIKKFIIPSHLYRDQIYDKWGNIILPNGQRLKGELFYDESVQKVLKEGKVLDSFTHWIKYPRTYHLPWSPGMHDDDRMMKNTSLFDDKEVIVTEKMDGENTTMYCDHIHARSINSGGHLSRDWVKNFWSQIKYDIPMEWSIRGENLYAAHSILYNELPTYFMGFSIWDDKNTCLSWDETAEWFALLGIESVPIIYRGIYNKQKIKSICSKYIGDCSTKEGYVIRLASSFPMSKFRFAVGKYVRTGHVLTTKHWMLGQPIVPNRLKDK